MVKRFLLPWTESVFPHSHSFLLPFYPLIAVSLARHPLTIPPLDCSLLCLLLIFARCCDFVDTYIDRHSFLSCFRPSYVDYLFSHASFSIFLVCRATLPPSSTFCSIIQMASFFYNPIHHRLFFFQLGQLTRAKTGLSINGQYDS
jgi:hypothetical protein